MEPLAVAYRSRLVLLAGLLVLLAGCSRGSPTAPSPETVALTGTVRDASSDLGPIQGTRVEILGGVNAGRQTVTDSDGRYALADLTPGNVDVQFSHESYGTVRRMLALARDTVLDVAMERVLQQTFTLAGSIRTPWNELLGDVGVEAVHEGRVVGGGTTNSAGEYRIPTLPPQEYLVRAVKWGYTTPDRQIAMTGDMRLDFVMDRNRGTIAGSVEEAPPCVAQAVDAARVEVVTGPDAGAFAVVEGFSGYRLTGIAWGLIRVRASKPGYASSEVTLDIPSPGGSVTSQHFRLQSTVGRYALSGDVSSSAGGPIDDALVEITSGLNAGRSTRSGAGGLGSGVYRLDNLISSFMEIRVTKAGFAPAVLTGIPLCQDLRRDVLLSPQ